MKNPGKCLSVILLALTLLPLAGCASTPTMESTGEYLDDSIITARVKAAIYRVSPLRSTEINVETFKGVVQLSGFVSTREAANLAVSTARRVPGVTSVKDAMLIK